MAERETWADRRQRRVRCKAHGLHYDPDLASGCTLCLKESARMQPRRAPQFTIILLCVLGMAVVLFQIFGPQGGAEAGMEDAAPPEGIPSAKLDPGAFEPQILALERDLFGQVADDLALASTGASVTTAARNLSDAIRERVSSSETGRAAAEAVAGLRPSGDGPFDFRALERLRGDWLRIRQRFFAAAPWFVTPDRRGALERVAAAEFSALASRLEGSFEDLRSEVQAYGDSAGQADRDQRFQAFHDDWRKRLAEIWNDRPPQPEAGADPQLLLAVQKLEQAFKRGWSLTADPSFVRGSDPAARLDAILREIQEARDELASTARPSSAAA